MEQPPINTLVNSDQIPEALKAIDHWVNWEPRYSEERGKYDKIPRTPAGSPASHSDPQTWSDFDSVLACSSRGSRLW